MWARLVSANPTKAGRLRAMQERPVGPEAQEDMIQEEWRAVPGHKGLSSSLLGRVLTGRSAEKVARWLADKDAAWLESEYGPKLAELRT